MAGTAEVIGNETALAHHFGDRDVDSRIADGYQALMNQIGACNSPTDIPVAISYGVEEGDRDFDGQESKTVFAMVDGRNPLFRSVVTTEEISLPGDPTDKEVITTRTLQLVAPKIITMSGALFIPSTRISDIREIVSPFSLGYIEETQSELGAPVYSTYRSDVFMYNYTLAVGGVAVASKLIDRLLREKTGDSLETALSCREIFTRAGVSFSGISRVIYSAMNFTDSLKSLEPIHRVAQ